MIMSMEEKKYEHGAEEVDINVAVREEPRKDFILPVSIIVAALMIGGAVVFSTLYKGGAAPANNIAGDAAGNAALPDANAVPSSASTTAILALGSRDAILGNKNAPVTIIEYGDYQCPYCAQYFQNVEPAIVKGYLDTGKAKMVFRNLAFLGAESISAAEAAECAEDQNQLWPYHDALYTAKLADFNNGGKEDDGLFNRTLFLKIATQLHLDVAAFTTCIDTNKYASLVAQEKADAYTAIGAYSTPATFVNGVSVTDSNGNSVGASPAAVLAAIAKAVGK
jgi:protein-disulfide isomerase